MSSAGRTRTPSAKAQEAAAAARKPFKAPVRAAREPVSQNEPAAQLPAAVAADDATEEPAGAPGAVVGEPEGAVPEGACARRTCGVRRPPVVSLARRVPLTHAALASRRPWHAARGGHGADRRGACAAAEQRWSAIQPLPATSSNLGFRSFHLAGPRCGRRCRRDRAGRASPAQPACSRGDGRRSAAVCCSCSCTCTAPAGGAAWRSCGQQRRRRCVF